MKVTILSGVPGCGKSTWASKQGADVVSADMFLPPNPGPADFGIAHGRCFDLFLCFLESGGKDVIVDNTCTTAVEIAPYVLAAQSQEIEVKVRRIVPSDYEACYRRNVHKVPFKTFCMMVAAFVKRDVMPWWDVEEVVA